MSEPIEFRDAAVASIDRERRQIVLIAAPYGEETALASGPGGRPMREVIAPGAFSGVETRKRHVTANREHDYTRTIGKVTGWRDLPEGLEATITVSDTDLGRETLTLAADGVLSASVGMMVRRSDQVSRAGVRTIRRAFLDHIALVASPAYEGATVREVREAETAPASTPNLDEVYRLLYGS